MTIGLSSCIALGDPPEPPVAATLIEGRPALVVPLCEGEGLESVYITDSSSDGEGPYLWRIDAIDEPVQRESFIVGEVPNGFHETEPLHRDALQSNVTAWATTEFADAFGDIDFRDVNDDELYLDFERVSAKDLRDDLFC
jgi:hypothetical protein